MAAHAHARAREVRVPVAYVIFVGLTLGVVDAASAALREDSKALLIVFYVAVGLAYLGAGYLVSIKGSPALGWVVALTGALWFIPGLAETRVEWIVGVSIVLEEVYIAAYSHAILAYPTGVIQPSSGAWLVGAAYVVTLLGGLAQSLTYQPYVWESCICPRNAFAISESESTYDTISTIYGIIGLLLAIGLLALVVLKLRRSGRDDASSMPLWAALLGTIIALAASAGMDAFNPSEDELTIAIVVEDIGYLALPLALLLVYGPMSEASHEPVRDAPPTDYR